MHQPRGGLTALEPAGGYTMALRVLAALGLIAGAAAQCPMGGRGGKLRGGDPSRRLESMRLPAGHPSIPPAVSADSNRTRAYAAALAGLPIQDVRDDVEALLTRSQPAWPADYGNYGPFFIRLA